jgi:hypothetical protein
MSFPYSYKMLIVPASKVSVPPIDVTRTLSKTPPRANDPPPHETAADVPVAPTIPTNLLASVLLALIINI